MHTRTRLLIQAGAVAILAHGGYALAQQGTVVRATSEPAPNYTEIAGNWTDSPTSAELPGLPPGIARQIAPTDGVLRGAAVFRLEVTQPGNYFLDILWPESANAREAAVQITAADQVSGFLVNLVPAGIEGSPAGQWVRLGGAPLPAGETVTVRVDGNASPEPIDPEAPHLLVVDAVRITPEDAAVVNPQIVRPLSPGEQLNLSMPDEAEVPFDLPAPDEMESPFDIPGQPDDPFDVPAPEPVDDPFDIPPAEPVDEAFDPFDIPAPDAVDDPFDIPPAEPMEESPFDLPGEAPPADPFAVEPAPADPAPGPAPMDDPFVMPDDYQPPAIPDDIDPFALPREAEPDPFPFGAPDLIGDPLSPAQAEQARRHMLPPDPESPFEIEPALPAPERDSMQIVQWRDPGARPAPDAALDDPLRDLLDTGAIQPGVGEPARPAAPPAAPPRELDFHASIEDAVRAAADTGRKVLVLFTGDTFRSTLIENALASPGLERTLQDFELVRIDYRANRTLARNYAVRDFPYVVIVNQYGFTEGHLIPTQDVEQLRRKLVPHMRAYF